KRNIFQTALTFHLMPEISASVSCQAVGMSNPYCDKAEVRQPSLSLRSLREQPNNVCIHFYLNVREPYCVLHHIRKTQAAIQHSPSADIRMHIRNPALETVCLRRIQGRGSA